MSRRTIAGWLAVLLSIAMAGVVATPVSAEVDDAPPPAADQLPGRYVVVMEDQPLVTEFGREEVASPEAKSRGAELNASHEVAAAAAGLPAGAIARNYTASLNGFAIELNENQLTRMKSVDGVLMVLEDVMRYKQTDASPDFLGLTQSGGAFRTGVDGEGVIIGVIDNGIWPEHPSFADDGSYPDPGIVLDESEYPACDFGNTAHNPVDVPFECNNKLIGARQILPTYRSVIGAEPFEFDSARDDDGHGTHTASTAGGNANVEASIFGRKFGKISGIAPRAHIIAYKGLGVLGGFTSDLAAAIDQAVLDGVDVINYSIGGGASDQLFADDISFLFASAAGVHVATSAGNSGPGDATVGGPAHLPWITTVGASTQPRFLQGRISAIGIPNILGASITQNTAGRKMLVDAEFAGGDLCVPGTLDPTLVEGKIVLCRRGAIGRAQKSLAVDLAGGAGMILYNNSDDDNLFTDNHFVPSVHIDNTPGLKLKEYIASRPNPRASLRAGETSKWKNAPTMTIFSSRGPNVFSDIIKPDVTAPGLQILAGNSPSTAPGAVQGELFQAIAGTSMSSPHVAGLMALIKQVHPDWSAAAVKSAMMTTAYQDVLDNDRTSPADPFDMGAGHIDPGKPNRKNSVFKPGLVYDAGIFEYFGFLCDASPGTFADPADTCGFLESVGIPTDASDLNLPSIGIGQLAGSQTVTRTVTSVSTDKPPREYTVSVDAPDGYEVTVTPSNIRLRPGDSATYQVTITNVSAPIGEWRHGSLTWSGGNHEARSPISVRGVSLAAPASVDGSGVDGSASVPVRFGYSGEYTAAAHGLNPATVISDTVVQDPDQNFDPADGFSNAYEVETSGEAFLRFALPPDSVNDPDIDLDMFVFGPAGELVGASTAGGTGEQVDILLPDDGTYTVYIHGWQTVTGAAEFDLSIWVISATPGGNMSIVSQPPDAVSGLESTVEVSWTGAMAGQWHLGAVSHADGAGLLGLTLIDVDNRAVEPAPTAATG